ncbi:MAG TPA: YceI family protein [Sphingomonadales bacterium]|nr:YceI family protein [Sphingomonadales bacterium]
MKKGLIAFAAVFALALGGLYWFRTAAMPGHWTVAPSESMFAFGSVKNGFIAEVHTLSGISGGADYTGEFSISLDLTSTATGVDIRDERMRDLFFETALYPVAVVNGTFNLADFENMKVGERKVLTLPVVISLHGVEQTRDIEISVVRLAFDKMLVASTKPVMVEAAEFNLEEGIERLREAVGLDSIAAAAPVTFAIVFEGSALPEGD